MRFAELCQTSHAVAATSRRREKIARLAACLRALGPDEIAVGVALLSGELPAGRIGVGYATVAALEVAPAAEGSLSLEDVARALAAIAGLAGRGSGKARDAQLGALFARATSAEQSVLRRLLAGELRQGALEGLLADALGQAAEVPADVVRRALMLSGDLGAVAVAAFAEGRAGLAGFCIEVGRPLAPMLADTAETLAEAFGAPGEHAFEYKLDGVRVQLHKRDDEVRVFSRQLHDVTAAVPEFVRAARVLPARALVLDGEAIALRADGRPHAFQDTMRRFGRRVLDRERLERELPLAVAFFDCLHLDGADLHDRALDERFALLAERLPAALLVTRSVPRDSAEAEAFVASALAAGHEGVMAKALGAPYAAGRRGAAWLKLKPAHTLDLVVLAVERGSGRRTRWLSNIHLGARDAVNGGFVMLGKTFKGMTDELLAWQTERLRALALHDEGSVVTVRPELVVEVAFDGVQRSPHYPGGLALRFARVRRYRPDKRAAEASTLDEVRAIFMRSRV